METQKKSKHGRAILNNLLAPGISTQSYSSYFVTLITFIPLLPDAIHLHNIYLTSPRSTLHPHSTYIRHQHPSSHMLLIHSLHVSKPYNTFESIRLPNSFSIPALLRILSFPNLSMYVTLKKLLNHFISITFTNSFSQYISYCR